MLNEENIKTQVKLGGVIDENLKLNNDLTTKITTGDVVINLNDNNKSMLEIGNIKIYNTKKFNWFQRKMFKIFFGIKISNVESKGE